MAGNCYDYINDLLSKIGEKNPAQNVILDVADVEGIGDITDSFITWDCMEYTVVPGQLTELEFKWDSMGKENYFLPF